MTEATIPSPPTTDVDLLIVGAGPAGLFGAFYAGFRGLRVAVIDALPEVGGQISAMYPEKPILDIAGFPSVKGRDLVAGLRMQADRFSPTYILGDRAVSLEPLEAPEGSTRFSISTDSGQLVHCGAVIITGGIGAFKPREIPIGHEYKGRGLAYFVPRLDEYRDCDVVVVGGGDSAFDWALALHEVAHSVTLVHRRDKFRAHAATVTEVQNLGVRIITNAEITSVVGTDEIEALILSGSGLENGDEQVPCQRLVAALGFVADLVPLRDWGVHIANNRHVVVDTAMRTSVPGVFAAGDITDYEGKVRLIAVGFGEVATAVNNAAVHLEPTADLFPGHSTDGSTTPIGSADSGALAAAAPLRTTSPEADDCASMSSSAPMAMAAEHEVTLSHFGPRSGPK